MGIHQPAACAPRAEDGGAMPGRRWRSDGRTRSALASAEQGERTTLGAELTGVDAELDGEKAEGRQDDGDACHDDEPSHGTLPILLL